MLLERKTFNGLGEPLNSSLATKILAFLQLNNEIRTDSKSSKARYACSFGKKVSVAWENMAAVD